MRWRSSERTEIDEVREGREKKQEGRGEAMEKKEGRDGDH